eukprot:TRINITY_DN30488_c0_g1_i1.p1 TRINITY_DN30488_c0_g1~~TRINITY_DN30488_c0_g1_i1.p1  ORF type:complete len:526 (+),score=97.38 TRINITY_DN30488_c0_g1_i1:184-1761(+)
MSLIPGMIKFNLEPKRASKRRRTVPVAAPVLANAKPEQQSRLRDGLISGRVKRMISNGLNAQKSRDVANPSESWVSGGGGSVMDQLIGLAADQFQPGEQLEMAGCTARELGKSGQIDLTINLYNDHFTLNHHKLQLRYDRAGLGFLHEVAACRIPVQFHSCWLSNRYDGCMLVRCNHYNKMVSNTTTPSCTHLLLWPTSEIATEVAQDLCNVLISEGKLVDEPGYQETLLAAEAQLLMCSPQSELCLDPDPLVAKISNHTHFNHHKWAGLWRDQPAYRAPDMSGLPEYAKVSPVLQLPPDNPVAPTTHTRKQNKKSARGSGANQQRSVGFAAQSTSQDLLAKYGLSSDQHMETLWQSVASLVKLAPQFKLRRIENVKRLREPGSHALLMQRQKVEPGGALVNDLTKDSSLEVPARRTLRFQRDLRLGGPTSTDKIRQISQLDTYRGSSGDFEALIRTHTGNEGAVATQKYTIGQACAAKLFSSQYKRTYIKEGHHCCLLYTSDAADEEDSVDLGGRRIIKKKKTA